MDLWDLTRLLFRRWYLAVPMLVVTLAAVGFTAATVKPDYSATGYVQLIPPTVSPDAAERSGRTPNPWAQLGVDALGRAAIIKVQDPTVVEQLVRSGYSESFTIGQDGGSPVLTVEAIGRTPEQASATVRQVIVQLTDAMATEQANYRVASQDAITAIVLNDGSHAEAVTSKPKRALIAVSAVGLLLTAALTIGVDALLRRRLRQRLATADEMDAVEDRRPSRRSDMGAPMRSRPSSPPARPPALSGGQWSSTTTDTGEHPLYTPQPVGTTGPGGPSVNVEYRGDRNGTAGTMHDPSEPGRGEGSRPQPPGRTDTDVTIILPPSVSSGMRKDGRSSR